MIKYLLLAALVSAAGCSSAPTKSQPLDPTHAAVSAYIKKNLGDTASYQPVRWGKPENLTRLDSARLAAMALFATKDEDDTDRGLALVKRVGADSLATAGISIVHAFRAKNKLGGLVLDSARFVVGKSGIVAVLP